MDDWKVVVTTILGAGGGALAIKLFDIFTKRAAPVAKMALKERSRRIIKDIELTGDAQKDIATIAQQMIREQRSAQDEIAEMSGEIASLKTANNALRESYETLKKQRDLALEENKSFIREITKLVEQSKDLTARLAKREAEFAMLSIDHEGAKARIEKYEATIAEMQQWVDTSNAEKAVLEAELERARTRGAS